jgi:hypothetical protein
MRAFAADRRAAVIIPFREATSVRVPNSRRRAVLRSGFAPVVEARRRDIRMSEPLLDLGDVSLMGERVSRSGRSQRVHT